jgi:hypothetical protein
MTFEQVRFDVSIDSKKLDILSLFAKSEMLKQDECQTTHFQGTNSTFNVIFLHEKLCDSRRFFELRNVDDCGFSFHANQSITYH